MTTNSTAPWKKVEWHILDQILRLHLSSCNIFILYSETLTCVYSQHERFSRRNVAFTHGCFLVSHLCCSFQPCYLFCFQCSRIVPLYVASKFSSARLIWKSNASLHFSHHTSSRARWLKTLNQASATVQQSEITGQEYGSSHALHWA